LSRDLQRIFDEYLVASAQAGDRKALAALAGRWQGRLLAHAARLTGEREAARDVAQESWADIMRGLSRLDDAAAFPAFAYRIVTRRAADAVRRRTRDRRTEHALAAEPQASPAGAEAVEAAADREPVRRALAALSPEQRATIALFYLEDLSVAEIAAALGVPAGTVKTRLMRAREALRAALTKGDADDRP
jgi:RNA polymerase sigma-70 factor (ECF subfamily)